MNSYSPLYTITPAIINLIAEISELLGRWSESGQLASPTLRKANRIRAIQSSLAIGHTHLSIEQIINIIEGLHIVAPTRNIIAVRNAIITYGKLPQLQSDNIGHLLETHAGLMAGISDFAGQWRSNNIERNKQFYPNMPPANQVTRLMHAVANWLKTTDTHPLIASCIVHYEIEIIQPFTDGNGEMSRLWQAVILSEWRKELTWLPFETVIDEKQNQYYQSLNDAAITGNVTCFIDFMLRAICHCLHENIAAKPDPLNTIEQFGAISAKNNAIYLNKTAFKILKIVKHHSKITIAELSEKLDVSSRTVVRNLKLLQSAGRLKRIGSSTKTRHWHVV